MLVLSRHEYIGTTAVFGSVTVQNVSAQFLAANTSRLSLLIYSDRVQRFTLSTASPVVLDQGLTIEALGPPFQIDRNNWGGRIEALIRGINNGAGNITVYYNQIALS